MYVCVCGGGVSAGINCFVMKINYESKCFLWAVYFMQLTAFYLSDMQQASRTF